MNAKLLLVGEFVDIKMAIEENITECDKVIEECQKTYVNPHIWIDKKANLINALSKLEKRYYKGEL